MGADVRHPHDHRYEILVDGRGAGLYYAHLMLGRILQRQSRHDDAERWLRMAVAFSGEIPAGDLPADW